MPGIRPAIVDAGLFTAVQQRLDAQARRFKAKPNRVAAAPLTGRLFDAIGQPMSPTFSHGALGQVYRYYVSAPLQQGAKADGNALRRVAASALEPLLDETLQRLLPSRDRALALVSRVELYPASLHLLLPVKLLAAVRARLQPGEVVQPDDADPARLPLVLPVRVRRRGGRVAIDTPNGRSRRGGPDAALVRALRVAHDQVTTVAGQPRIERSAPTAQGRRLARLAFLAPDLQVAILVGEQPAGTTLDWLIARPLPLLWRHQREALHARS